jgi:hypothetical protein
VSQRAISRRFAGWDTEFVADIQFGQGLRQLVLETGFVDGETLAAAFA